MSDILLENLTKSFFGENSFQHRCEKNNLKNSLFTVNIYVFIRCISNRYLHFYLCTNTIGLQMYYQKKSIFS